MITGDPPLPDAVELRVDWLHGPVHDWLMVPAHVHDEMHKEQMSHEHRKNTHGS